MLSFGSVAIWPQTDLQEARPSAAVAAYECPTSTTTGDRAGATLPAGVSILTENSGQYPWVVQPAAFREAIDGFIEA